MVWFFLFLLVISTDWQDWEEMVAPGYMSHLPN